MSGHGEANPQQLTSFNEDALRMFLFEEIFSYRAAQEQAEKKKLAAFGMLAKFNPLNRPRPENVSLVRHELRLEPFWHVKANREVNFICECTYLVPANNPYTKKVTINDVEYEANPGNPEPFIEVPAQEICKRSVDFEFCLDGLGRDIKSATFANYINRYPAEDHETLQRDEIVQPKISLSSVLQTVNARLNSEAINAARILSDKIQIYRAQLYLRPVYAFEYNWEGNDRVGVIEVNALTGEVQENGSWFKDKMADLMTREMLVDVGAEVAGAFFPGGAAAVKLIDRLN